MSENRIRPIAICVCRQGDRILVAEYREKGHLYYRPLGGAIEFGERGAETVRREFREEIGADLTDICYVGMLENIYSIDGEPCHQIVLIYDAIISESELYAQEVIPVDELGESLQAGWKRLDEFSEARSPLYPSGLIELLIS